MSAVAEKRLTVEEFLIWAEGRDGVWELCDGAPIAMAPERVTHARVKPFTAATLLSAIRAAHAPCGAYAEGIAVRIRADQVFVPDVFVVCPEPPDDAVAISDPLIVVEVSSQSTAARDHGVELEAYFSLPSLAHYLILDPDRRVVIHHIRGDEGAIVTRILREGRLRLDPPGLEIAIAEFFAPAD